VTNCGYKVGQMFKRIVARAKKARPGLTFYALRHTFQTVAEGARDLVAVQAIMGHAPSSSDMSAVYRERVDDDRLRAVVDHVRRWLWPVAGTKEGK
jgi:integrase